MKKDLKSLIQYSKDILDKHGPEAKSPNKHHPILTHDLIMCLKEIIQPDKGGKFVFRKENIVFKISGRGDHQTPLNYIIYIICRILLEIKDYSIIYTNIHNDLDLIETKVQQMNKNELMGIAARIRDILHRGDTRINLNCIIHCEETNPPKKIRRRLPNGINPFSNIWNSDILLTVQNIIIDILNENEHLINIIDKNIIQTDYEILIQTELINCLGEIIFQKSKMKKSSDEMIQDLLEIGTTIDNYKEIIGLHNLSKYMCNASYYDHLKDDIEQHNYYKDKKKPDELRKMMQKLDKERKGYHQKCLQKLKSDNLITWAQEFYGNLDLTKYNSPNTVDQVKFISQMIQDCDGITIREQVESLS